MTPKIIHYCWFGGNPKPKIVLQCIESWKKFCPDLEIREWNESNWDISEYAYAKEAYECKKWAFVADVARFDIMQNMGGYIWIRMLRYCNRFRNLFYQIIRML